MSSFPQVFPLCDTFFLGLSYGTDDQSLRESFTGFGEVVEGMCSFHLYIDPIIFWCYELTWSSRCS